MFKKKIVDFKHHTENKIYLLYFLIAIAAFMFFYTHSDVRGLNRDDLASIHVIAGRHSWSELMNRHIEMGLQPPLETVILYLWAQIAPATVECIKIPSMIAVSLAVFVMGCLGKKVVNSVGGALAAIFMAASYYSFIECVFSARSYGFFVLTSTFAFWVHCIISEKREENKVSYPMCILYAISLAILMYTHYFGMILAFSFGVVDSFRMIVEKKQRDVISNNIKILASYAGALILYIPWGMVMVQEYGEYIMSWTTSPTFKSIFILGYYYFSNVWLTAAFALAFLISVICIIKEKKYDCKIKMICSYLAVVIINIVIPFIYSAYINPNNSVWVRRYFCGLMPAVYVICAFAVVEISKHFKKAGNIFVVISCAIYVWSNLYGIPLNGKNHENEVYANTIDYLEKEKVDEREDVAIYSSWWGDAFNYFYTNNFRNERRPAITELNEKTVTSNINTIYLITVHVHDWQEFMENTGFELETIDNDAMIAKYKKTKVNVED